MKKNEKKLSAGVYTFWGPLLFILLTLLDQGTKALAVKHLKDQADVILIPGALEFTYLENRGMAFGILQGKRFFFIAVCVIFFAIFWYFYKRVPKTVKYLPLILISLVMTAGAVGNFLDRIFRGYVVDFIYLSLIRFPVFNVADIYVVCSGIVLVLVMVLKYKDDRDFDFLKIKNKR